MRNLSDVMYYKYYVSQVYVQQKIVLWLVLEYES